MRGSQEIRKELLTNALVAFLGKETRHEIWELAAGTEMPMESQGLGRLLTKEMKARNTWPFLPTQDLLLRSS